MYVKTDL